MTRLKQRIAADILASGPISVADYMARCLYDPDDGYYMVREPFGAQGDFVTAPEVSQMFGELVAIWLYAAWTAAGRPQPVALAEIGPGRGTLARDVLRTLAKLDPGFLPGAKTFLIETSPRLGGIQRKTLGESAAEVAWLADVDQLPDLPLLIVGNEIFDAMPIRQFVKTETGWRERLVGIDEHGQLGFLAGPAALDPGLAPPDADNAPPGAVAEVAPAQAALMQRIAERIATLGIAGVFFDYGHLHSAAGDTLQALSGHRYADIFEAPGEADLTAHVDFEQLAAVATSAGLVPHLANQGDFLLAMGLLERAGALGASADAVTREALSQAVERLAGPDAMGTLFKVLAVARPGLAVSGFEPARAAG